jgi:hypothetical protein
MVSAGQATWPTHTNKPYPDISTGTWDPPTDVDGTEIYIFDDAIWEPDSGDSYLEMAAMDYFYDRLPSTGNDNYGWSAPLEFDEYPLEIQCSSCFQ